MWDGQTHNTCTVVYSMSEFTDLKPHRFEISENFIHFSPSSHSTPSKSFRYSKDENSGSSAKREGNELQVIDRLMQNENNDLSVVEEVQAQPTPTVSNTPTAQAIGPTETDEDRIARENRESEMLAWEMMRQESAELYQMQLQFMQENAEQMSEEDMMAVQAAINESGRLDMIPVGSNSRRMEVHNEDVNEDDRSQVDDDSNSNSNDSSEVDDDPDNWDYERLLSLGHALGGLVAFQFQFFFFKLFAKMLRLSDGGKKLPL